MKKLLIASVSVLALSAAGTFAQPSNTSDLEQNGVSNYAKVEQVIGTGISNSSTVYQGVGGNNHAASNGAVTVTQLGGNSSKLVSGIVQNDSYQTATVIQTGTNGGNLTSGIAQSGYDNTAVVNQTGGASVTQTSSVTQSGQYGRVTINQTGPSASSNVSQGGNHDNPTDASGTTPFQGTVLGGVNVNQSGPSTNTSSVVQNSDYSGVVVIQNSAGPAGTNSSSVNQGTGSSNFASVWQTTNTAGQINTSVLTQSGTGNIAGVFQH